MQLASDLLPLLLSSKKAAHWVIRDGNKDQKKAQKIPNWEIATNSLIIQLDLKEQWRNWCEGRGSKTGGSGGGKGD